jgi:hypothetical protein
MIVLTGARLAMNAAATGPGGRQRRLRPGIPDP